MMNVPMTYLFPFTELDEKYRRMMLHTYAEIGFKNMVFTVEHMKQCVKNGDMMKVYRDELEAEGLKFVDSHALFGAFYDLRTVDPATRPYVVCLDKLELNIVAEMGINTITMHPGADALNPDIPIEVQTDNVKRILEEIIPEAEKCGVTICIENSWSRLSCPNNLLRIKAALPTDTLGFCYDSGHANILSSNAKQYETCTARDRWTVAYGLEPEWEDAAIDKMLPHIVNCHLHDNTAEKDQHNLPGTGSVDWPHVVECLKKAPRLQCIQSEFPASRYATSPQTVFNVYEKLFD